MDRVGARQVRVGIVRPGCAGLPYVPAPMIGCVLHRHRRGCTTDAASALCACFAWLRMGLGTSERRFARSLAPQQNYGTVWIATDVEAVATPITHTIWACRPLDFMRASV